MKSNQFISSASNAIKGEITVPGDKSISHRAIILGAIAKGTTRIKGFLNGEDCLATLKAFEQMGVSIEQPKADEVIIDGVGKNGLNNPFQPLDCGNSGTSMRLLAGLLSAQQFDSRLTGDNSLLKRPMDRISRPLNQMGAGIITHDKYPPLDIQGGKKLTAISYDMPVASAQVKSAILLAGMYAEGDTIITETGITRDHTERMLTTFSYPISKSENIISINSLHDCNATNINVPGDISSAAFLMVAACIIPGSDLIIKNVGINPTRTGIIQLLKLMGASISIFNKRLYGEEPAADIQIKYSALEGIDIPTNLVPLAIDEFPILFIAAAVAKGHTILHGAKELRVKESDRIAVMAEGLRELGINAKEMEDGLYIEGGVLEGGDIESHGDHRIAMAFSIAGAVSKQPIRINDCYNVQTSFPGFIQTALKTGLSIKESTL